MESGDATEVLPFLSLSCCNARKPLAHASGQERIAEPLTQLLDIWLSRLERANQRQLREFTSILEDSIREHIQAVLHQTEPPQGANAYGLSARGESSLLEAAQEANQDSRDRKVVTSSINSCSLESPFDLEISPVNEDVPPEHCGEDEPLPCTKTSASDALALVDSPKSSSSVALVDSPKSPSTGDDSKERANRAPELIDTSYKVQDAVVATRSTDSNGSNRNRSLVTHRNSGGWLKRVTRVSTESRHSAGKSLGFGLFRSNTLEIEKSISSRRGSAFQNTVQTTFRRRQALYHREMETMDFMFASPFRTLVTSLPFKIATAVLILGNAAFIGIQTQWHAELELESKQQTDTDGNAWQAWEAGFVAAFILELLIRLLAYRWTFFYNKEWRWNVFDFTIVLLSVIEVVQNQVIKGTSINFPILRLIRVTRVVRILKFISMVPFFRHLTVMISSVADSLQALLPAVALLLLIMYCFGITILQGVVNYLNEDDPGGDEAADLQPRFGSFTATMLTLIMAISSGNSWVESYDLLHRVSPVYQAIFLIYIVFVQIGVLNIVTGIFVDTVHQMFKPDREDVIEKEARKRKEQINDIVEIFMEADADDSGQLTLQEFKDHLQKEDIQIYFQSLHLDVTEAHEVFKLMDADDTGTVSIDEFVDGFLCLRGQARSVDLWQMRHLLKHHTYRLKQFMSNITSELSVVVEAVERIRCKIEKPQAPVSPWTSENAPWTSENAFASETEERIRCKVDKPAAPVTRHTKTSEDAVEDKAPPHPPTPRKVARTVSFECAPED